MQQFVIWLIFIVSTILFWMLVFRILATIFRLDPYHPLTRFLFHFTNIYVRPFRFGPFRRAARIDPAVIPPMVLLTVIIIVCIWNL